MVNAILVKNRIIDIIKRRGPSLPIQIAKEVGLNSLFVSAFLSELSNEKKLRISSLKVGGSPLYFLEGQTEQLEKFHRYMHPKESEAFLLLKNNKVLKDSLQDPAIRVALRSIKDFSVGFTNDNEIYWRYILVPESEVEKLFSDKKQDIKIEEKIKKESIEDMSKQAIANIEQPEIEVKNKPEKNTEKETVTKTEEIKKEKKSRQTILKIKEEDKGKQEFLNPLVEKLDEKPKKEKPKSEFALKTISYLEKNGFRIIEEIEYSKKEYLCISEFDTELGPISFLTLAKDKKSVSEEDLRKLLSDSQRKPIPALFISPGEMNKKAKEYQEKYYSILKYKKMS
jgi:hypothetical protein